MNRILALPFAFATVLLSAPTYNRARAETQAQGNVRDSAGVRIVEFFMDSATEAKVAFRLSEAPTVTLTTTGGRGGSAISVAARRLPDGRIIAASGTLGTTTTVLRVIDGNGKVVDTLDNMPGVSAVCPYRGDSLLVVHSRGQLSFVSSSGAIARSGTLMPGRLYCPAGDALFLRPNVIGPSTVRASGRPQPTNEIRRDSIRILHFGPASPFPILHELGPFPGTDLYMTSTPTNTTVREYVIGWRPQPYGRVGAVATDGNQLYVTDGGPVWEVKTYSAEGKLVRILRVKTPAERVRAERRAEHAEAIYAGAGGSCADKALLDTNQRLKDTTIYAAFTPSMHSIMTDRAGRLWVRDYPRLGVRNHGYMVFTRDAHYLGRVSLPLDLNVEEIGADYVLGNFAVRPATPPCSDAVRPENITMYELRMYQLRPGA